MKKSLTRLFCCVALLTTLTALVPEMAKGQQQHILVTPTEVYRFTISPISGNTGDGGYMLTGSWQEGLAWGYNPDILPVRGSRNGTLGIYVPPSGYTPDPASGLVALHRWRVIEYGWRNYFYYSTYYANLGGNYHYEGIQGYVFPPGQTTFRGAPLSQVSSWYSVTHGYWNGGGNIPEDVGFFFELPPDSTFDHQGITCAMPVGVASTRFPNPNLQHPTFFDVFFNAPTSPPPPPPGSNSCNPNAEQSCAQNGGSWDQDSCTCNNEGGSLLICCE